VLVVSHIVFAFAQEFGAKPFFVWKGNPQGVKLVTGMFGHYNPFAGFLNGSLFFFLTYVCLGKDSKLRILHGVVVVGILVALALSQSRGGWLALASGGAIWLVVLLTYLKFTKSRAFGGALAAGCLMAVLGIFAAIWAVQRISEKRAEAKHGIAIVLRSRVILPISFITSIYKLFRTMGHWAYFLC